MSPSPYYSDEFVTLFHSDWRDVVHLAVAADLLLTDPPYGVGLRTGYKAAARSNLATSKDYAKIQGDEKPFDPSPFLGYPGVVLWGANYYADKLPARGPWLIWDKRDGGTSDDGADAELAWVDGVPGTVPRLFSHKWRGMIKASERDQRRVHPSQKPVALMSWCLSFFPDARFVFDPFCGSGPILRACKDRRVRVIAAETVEQYCEAAARRCHQEVLDFGGAV